MKIIFALVLSFLVLVAGIGFWYWRQLSPASSTSSTFFSFDIAKNQTATSVLEKLQTEGLIRSSLAARIYLRLSGGNTVLLPGNYQISPNLSSPQIIDLLSRGPEDIRVTLPEGWRREQMAARLAESIPEFNSADFVRLSAGLEGTLFPDTYLIPAQASASDVINVLTANFSKKTGLNPQNPQDRQTIILASLVEREARTDSDRRLIAGIIFKRLKEDWPLQIDASVQYAMGTQSCASKPLAECSWWPTDVDTGYPSSYNTYLSPGLPPGAICNPGLAAINAVRDPQSSGYWFYLTDPVGVTHFSVSLSEHQANIDKYLKR